jgi:hypothetical protein
MILFFCFIFSQLVAQSLREKLDRTITRPDSAEIIFSEEKQNIRLSHDAGLLPISKRKNDIENRARHGL